MKLVLYLHPHDDTEQLGGRVLVSHLFSHSSDHLLAPADIYYCFFIAIFFTQSFKCLPVLALSTHHHVTGFASFLTQLLFCLFVLACCPTYLSILPSYSGLLPHLLRLAAPLTQTCCLTCSGLLGLTAPLRLAASLIQACCPTYPGLLPHLLGLAAPLTQASCASLTQACCPHLVPQLTRACYSTYPGLLLRLAAPLTQACCRFVASLVQARYHRALIIITSRTPTNSRVLPPSVHPAYIKSLPAKAERRTS